MKRLNIRATHKVLFHSFLQFLHGFCNIWTTIFETLAVVITAYAVIFVWALYLTFSDIAPEQVNDYTFVQWQESINAIFDISAQLTWRGLWFWLALIAIRLAIRTYLGKRNVVQTDITTTQI